MSRAPRSSAAAFALVAALLCPLVAAGCSKAASKTIAATTTTKPPAPTTTVPQGPPYPLTGLPVTSLAQLRHPAIVVKMDNSPWARPQTAINQADIVFELLVEGITRYALVFGSDLPTRVGPVRSARSSDIDLLAGLGRPLLAWSGANPTVIGQVEAAAQAGLLVDASRGANPPEYWRDLTREAPHNLYTNLPMLLSMFGGGAKNPPQAILPFAKPGTALPPTARPIAGVTINFGDGVAAQYVWDARRKGWARYQIDQLHDLAHSATLDSAGVQVAPPNVVVLFLHYGVSVADPRSPQAISTGQGTGEVFTEGRLIDIDWFRPGHTNSFRFTTTTGRPFALPPGRTWVALPEVGAVVTGMTPAVARSWLAIRS
ncbi:MAG TPA: DUF3048 domain-containing protein [Acidimicrobiales bacterium]|nr:DUF3048 domain-containing protein [Acidimicrobiales bacterium]